MACKSCGSESVRKFRAEIGIHFAEFTNIKKPTIWVFPELLICLDCGIAQFAVPESELGRLAKGDSAASG